MLLLSIRISTQLNAQGQRFGGDVSAGADGDPHRVRQEQRAQLAGEPHPAPVRAAHDSRPRGPRQEQAAGEPPGKIDKGASIYDVRSGWGERSPQKADERNKIS